MGTYDTGVVLEVEEDTVEALPGLGLADDDGGVDLLAELRLALLDGGHDHVADTTSGEAVETSTDTLDGDDVKVTGTGVVRAVHDGTAVRVAMLAIHSCLGRVVRAFRDLWVYGVPIRDVHRARARLGNGDSRFVLDGTGMGIVTYTGRPRVILSLPPGAPRL